MLWFGDARAMRVSSGSAALWRWFGDARDARVAGSGGRSVREVSKSGIVGAMSQQIRRRPRRVGHKGAAHIETGNTLASFDAALEHDVDMIELDVLSEHPRGGDAAADSGGRLLVAHDYEDMRARADVLELDAALAHLAGERFAALELDVDVKLPGYELRVLDALRAHGLVERTLVSSMFPASLALLRAAEPGLRLGWSVPRVRRDYTRDMLTAAPALAMLVGYRAALPLRVRAALRGGRVDAIMAHWRVVSGGLLRAVREGGGELYVWTVDDARRIERLVALGVDGIITNDPRLFDVVGPGLGGVGLSREST